MNVYHVTEQLQLAIDGLNLYKEDGSIDEKTFNDTMEGLQGELEFRHRDIAAMIKNLESDWEQMAKAVGEIKERMEKNSDKNSYLQKILLDSMARNKIKKHKYPEFDITVRESSRVIISDLNSLPEQFIRRKETVEADRGLLKEYLKENELQGATLEKFQSVQVK